MASKDPTLSAISRVVDLTLMPDRHNSYNAPTLAWVTMKSAIVFLLDLDHKEEPVVVATKDGRISIEFEKATVMVHPDGKIDCVHEGAVLVNRDLILSTLREKP